MYNRVSKNDLERKIPKKSLKKTTKIKRKVIQKNSNFHQKIKKEE